MAENRKRTGTGRRWFKRCAIALCVILLLPYVATLVYALVPPPVSSLMLLRKLEGQTLDYRWRPIGQISPKLVLAVVTSEDARICQHNGVDWTIMNKVISNAVETGEAPTHGGSTIPMQTAKNLFLWPSRSYLRKAYEIPLAYWIDLIWPKKRIVEIYLNIAEWAPGVYGAEAAAWHHFKKSAEKLSEREARLLAAALPNPFVRNAGRPGPKVRRMAARLKKRLKPTKPYLACLKS